MNNTLLIGSHGYIGSFLRTKIQCDCVDLFIGVDYRELTNFFLEKYDTIILLAGNSSVASCLDNQLSSFKNNVENFLILLEKLKNIKKRQKLIYASSSSVYGKSDINMATETYNRFVPHNTYDITKHFIDILASDSNVEYYGLRFGTVCGYSPILRTDVMINSMVNSAKENGFIKLYIKETRRPILGIVDLSNAISRIVNTDEDKRGVYNLHSFNSTSEEIANDVAKICDVPIIELKIPNNITNSKEQTTNYDFSLSSDKFINNFLFKFEENVESIVNSLLFKWDEMIKINRSQKIIYEP